MGDCTVWFGKDQDDLAPQKTAHKLGYVNVSASTCSMLQLRDHLAEVIMIVAFIVSSILPYHAPIYILCQYVVSVQE